MFLFGEPIFLYGGTGMVLLLILYLAHVHPSLHPYIHTRTYSCSSAGGPSKNSVAFLRHHLVEMKVRATKWYHTMTFGFLSPLCRINPKTQKIVLLHDMLLKHQFHQLWCDA